MKIAFLFLVYDDINYDQLWQKFFSKSDQSKHSIYVHSKKTHTLSDFFTSKRTIENTETKWADISLVKAQNILLQEALKDEDNQRFVFVSDSCIPVKSFEYVYQRICSNKKSLFNHRKLEYPQRYTALKSIIGSKFVMKASQWCILNRKHAQQIINEVDERWYDIFSKVFAPDEIAYITTLNLILNNLKDEVEFDENKCYSTTFTNWGMDPDGISPEYKYEQPEINRVKTYNQIIENEILDIIKSKSFFARKFTKDCQVLTHYTNKNVNSLVPVNGFVCSRLSWYLDSILDSFDFFIKNRLTDDDNNL